MNDSGLLIVVSGPSGAGKGTICAALRKLFPNIQYSISMTTRQPRPGEVDGVNYYFADNARFEQMLSEDAFLEHAKVYDLYYGTPKKYVYQVLEHRLRSRQTDTEEVIAGRLSKAREELDWIDRYDYVIVNDDLDTAIDDAASIIKAEQCKVMRNVKNIAQTKELYK